VATPFSSLPPTRPGRWADVMMSLPHDANARPDDVISRTNAGSRSKAKLLLRKKKHQEVLLANADQQLANIEELVRRNACTLLFLQPSLGGLHNSIAVLHAILTSHPIPRLPVTPSRQIVQPSLCPFSREVNAACMLWSYSLVISPARKFGST